jgi:hypothetical protein
VQFYCRSSMLILSLDNAARPKTNGFCFPNRCECATPRKKKLIYSAFLLPEIIKWLEGRMFEFIAAINGPRKQEEKEVEMRKGCMRCICIA